MRHMRRQWMTAGLVEERGFLGGRFQELLVLGVDVVAELHGLVLGHPGGEIDPGDRHLLRQRDLLMLARGDRSIDGRAIPLLHLFRKQPGREVAHIVDARAAMGVEPIIIAEQVLLVGVVHVNGVGVRHVDTHFAQGVPAARLLAERQR